MFLYILYENKQPGTRQVLSYPSYPRFFHFSTFALTSTTKVFLISTGAHHSTFPLGKTPPVLLEATKGKKCICARGSGHLVVPGTTIFREGNPQTKKKSRKHPLHREPGDGQHDVQADRVGEPSLYPHRRHGVHG